VYTERPSGDSASTPKRNRALRLLYSIIALHRIAARLRFQLKPSSPFGRQTVQRRR